MTSSRRPRACGDRPRGERGIDALVVRDGDDVQAGAVLGVVEDLVHARDAVRGERVDVQVGAAHQALRLRLGRVAGRDVVPDLEEERPPLLRGIGDDALEGGHLGSHEGAQPLARRATGGHLELLDARRVARAGAPRSDDPGWRAGLEREHGRTGGQARRRPEQLDPRAPATQRPIGHERHGLVAQPARARTLAAAPLSGMTLMPG